MSAGRGRRRSAKIRPFRPPWCNSKGVTPIAGCMHDCAHDKRAKHVEDVKEKLHRIWKLIRGSNYTVGQQEECRSTGSLKFSLFCPKISLLLSSLCEPEWEGEFTAVQIKVSFQVRWAQQNQPPSSASPPPLCQERKQSDGALPRIEDINMGVLTEEEKEMEHQKRVMQEGKGACSAQEQMKPVPQLTWADKLRNPLQGQALTIQRGQGSPGTGKLEIPLDGLPQARAFFMTKFLLPSETRVVTQGGKQVMVKAYPNHGVESRDEIYTKHASNWVFHDDAAFKSVNDKARWIGRRLEILKNSADLARDHFLVQPVTNNVFTVLALHEADKKEMDGWKRLRCERSKVTIHPWVPQRRLGPEEKRAQLMRDFHWVEFRQIPVEIQAAFVYDFGLLYDIVAFIDPLPSYVAKRDDYLMLALDFPPGQPFSLDDIEQGGGNGETRRGSGEEVGRHDVVSMEIETTHDSPTALQGSGGGEMEVVAGWKGPREEVQMQEGGLQEDQMVEVDPFQPAFDPEPVEVDPLPTNVGAVLEGLPCEEGEKEGIPPQHLPVEQKLVDIADWLLTNLKAKYGPLTDDFWDRTYLELFPMLDMSAALKGVLENGLQCGLKWTEVWHRVASIVLARFQPPPASHPAAAEEIKVSNQTEGSILQSPVLPPGPAPSDLDEDAPLDLVRRRKLRHLIEMGQDTGPLSQEATLLLPVRKKNRKWEVGLTPVDHGKMKGVTLQGWSSFWAGHCRSEAAAGIFQMQLETHIAEFMPPGAQATAPLVIEPNRASQRDTLIRYDPDKDAGLRWFTPPELLDMQTVKTKASEVIVDAFGGRVEEHEAVGGVCDAWESSGGGGVAGEGEGKRIVDVRWAIGATKDVTGGGDNMAEVFGARSGKRTFADLGVEFLLSEDREDLAEVLKVGLEGGAEDKDVIKVDNDTDFEEVEEDVVHGGLEGSGGIGESEWHHEELVVREPRVEGGLVSVLLADTDLVEATTKVDLGKVLGSTETIKELGNPR
ncbi:hypothetical protein CBR_g18609 [Chara braunii]|uniref:Uncharacterized protein n=1 Tax=Chara braunii TaxID=69332 RepID=A0A388JTC8_CHABU|nr:hypothetical protein CBR_g18609 [Chara braunii]|eukprot:GBG61013.1 hypothetical protein CBR_g18609 [Chara braunii]